MSVKLATRERKAREATGGEIVQPAARDDADALRRAIRQLTDEVVSLRHDLKATLTPKWKTKPFYTVKELAGHLGRSAYTIRRWIRQGKIHALKLNSGGPRDPYLIEHAEVEELLLHGDTRDRVIVNN